MARKSGVKEVVMLEVQTGTFGRVKKVIILRPIDSLLDKAAIDAVRQWKYEPKLFNERPREFKTE